MTDLPEPLQADLLAGANGCRHGFLTRRGGVSEGIWASLNVGWRSGDEVGRVRENRRRIAGRFGAGADALVSARQIHSDRAVILGEPWRDAEPSEADGLVTSRPGLWLGVLGADCCPVLLADPIHAVVGAFHAGWRGALAGIVENTVATMERAGAERHHILAAIGPTIARSSYEVGEDFQERFLERYPEAAERFIVPQGRTRPHFDLPGFVADRLRSAGVGAIEDIRRDTYEDEELFFSCRRAASKTDKRFGLQMSVIGLV